MGRGNVCTFGKYEGLYYADRDYLDSYTAKEANEYGEFEQKMLEEMSMDDFNNYDYDAALSEMNYEDFISEFISMFTKKFKSFSATGKTYGVILENNLFEVEVEDNEWSYAVKLIQKEHWCYSLEGLQAKHYRNYLEGIKTAMLEIFPSIGCYGGAWSSGRITREDAA